MHFLPLFTGTHHLAHVLTVPPTKASLLCATPAGMDLYIQAVPVGTYRVQSPGFPKIVYYVLHPMFPNYSQFVSECSDVTRSTSPFSSVLVTELMA